MARTMQTARKTTGGPIPNAAEQARRQKDMAEATLKAEEEDFVMPSGVQSQRPIQSPAASSSRTDTTPSLTPTYNLLAADLPLRTIFAFTAQTLNISSEQLEGKMAEVLSAETQAQNYKNQGRKKKAVKANVDADGIEWLDNLNPRYEADDRNCRIYQEEQEMRLGIQVEFGYGNDKGRPMPAYREKGSYRNDPAIIKALTTLVRHAVGDNKKLFLKQDFCLKRQSDTSVDSANLKSMIVLDDEHQDNALFRYIEKNYTPTQRQIMQYTSCIPEDGKAEERHWRHALESLLASRNQQDEPFTTRVKIFLVNRSDDTVDRLQSGRDFSGAFPYFPFPNRYFDWNYQDRNKGIWKSLRIGFTFEVFANPAKLYTTPSNIVNLNNRRILLQAFCPGPVASRALASENAPASITLDDFYSNLSPAPIPSTSLDAYQPAGMTAQLMPFQKRSVAWLMQREQATEPRYENIWMWERLALGTGAETVTVAYNRVTGEVTPLSAFEAWNKGKGKAKEVDGGSRALVFEDEILQEERDDLGLKNIRGGMLCEEMGLGKTLETIALTMLSRESGVKDEIPMGTVTYDQVLELNVTKVSATLIVTPEALIRQWQSEIRKHAPGLKVVVYEGWRSVHNQFYASAGIGGKRKRGAQDVDANPEKSTMDRWVQKVTQADIVLTTYQNLAADWNVAAPPVKRARRSTAAYVEYARPRSALLLCDWRRVAIDEIQTLDIGSASNAANMVKSIKRQYSLAISGTPAKVSIEDLASSMSFLGANFSARVWKRLSTPAFAPTFHAIFNNIAIRHVKASLSPEDMTMKIPRQTRYLVPIKLDRVERAYYNDTYETSVDALQRSSGFEDTVQLRRVLHTLRGLCTHIQVGQLGPIAAGAERIRLDGGVLTMLEALGRMEEDAENLFLTRLVELAQSRMRQAQLLVLESSSNWPTAHTIYQDVYRECDKTLKDIQRRIEARRDTVNTINDGPDADSTTRDREAYISVLRSRTQTFHLLKHEAAFRLGDIFSSESVDDAKKAEKEEEWYGIASKIRSGLLESTALASNSYMDQVKNAVKRSKVDVFEDLEIDFAKQLGLLGTRIQEPLNIRIDALNDNAELVWNCRGKIVARLLEAIGDNVEDGSGAGVKDYDQTLEEQYELESNMWIYQLAMADRREFMTEERTALAMHEDRAAAARHAEEDNMVEPAARNAPAGGAAGADEDIKAKLVKERDTIRLAAQKGISLKAAQLELSQIAGRSDVRYQESFICKTEADRLKAVIKAQMDISKRLTDEFAVFNSCFNRRVAYYRNLQTISDTLVDVELKGSVEDDLARSTDRIIAAKAAYDKANARRRYLESIRNEDEETAVECPICQEGFGHRGAKEIVILSCLHRLCAPCYKTLRNRFRKSICPTCRAEIASGDDVKKITLQKPERTVEDGLGKISADDQSTSWLSAHIHPEHFLIAPEISDMLSIKVSGSWGSKVDRLVRHLRYWHLREPEVKHIIFSSWKDALTIVQAALSANDISWLSRTGAKNDTSVQRFNENPAITAFCLNGERENSGLTLTSASVCHLLEPVINSGFEMQAIGRVDRVGQVRETTVYCYAAEDTVEAKIVNRAKDNGNSLYAKVQNDTGNSRRAIAAASVARKGGDDLSGNRDDLLDLLLH